MIYNNSPIYIENIDVEKAGYVLNESLKNLVSIIASANDSICEVCLQKKGSFYGDGYIVFIGFERNFSPDQINTIINNISNTANNAGIEVYLEVVGSASFEEVKEEVVCICQN